MESLSTNKLIVLILVVVVIFVVIFGILFFGIPDILKNIFPGFEKEDGIDDVTVEGEICARIIAQIRENFIGTKYLYIRGEQTNLYLDDSVIKLSGGSDQFSLVGSTRGGVVNINSRFLGEKAPAYLKHSDILPHPVDLEFLHGSIMFGDDNFCQTSTQKEEADRLFNCEEQRKSCDIYGGVCKKSLSSGEIFYPDTNLCEKGIFCAVPKSGALLENKGLKINSFINALKRENLLTIKQLEFEYGEVFRIQYELSEGDWCSLLTTNKRFIPKELWVPELEEVVLELVAWNPKAVSQRVFRILPIKLKLPRGYFESNKVIRDEDFKKEIMKAKVGDRFYVFRVRYSFSDEASSKFDYYWNYEIIKNTADRVTIRRETSRGGFGIVRWHTLDCETRAFTFFENRLLISRITKNSLQENLAEFCQWD